jgi:hypothetical protein
MITFASLMLLWFIVSIVRIKSRMMNKGFDWVDSIYDNLFDYGGALFGGAIVITILITMIFIYLP